MQATSELFQELLDEERVAFGSPEDHLPQGNRSFRDKPGRVLRRERLEPDHRRVPAPPPRRPGGDQLGPRGADQHERAADPIEHILEKIEQVVLRPVQILDDDHGGTLRHDL